MKKFIIFLLFAMPLAAITPPPVSDTDVTTKFLTCKADPSLYSVNDVIYVNLTESEFFYIKSTYFDNFSSTQHFEVLVKVNKVFYTVDQDFAGILAAQNFINSIAEIFP